MLAQETPQWKAEEQRIQAIMAQMQSAGIALSLCKFLVGPALIGGCTAITAGSFGTASPAGLPMIGAGAAMLLTSGK